MELREWLIILGLVLVAIILVDGVRRLQRQRRGLRMDLSRDIDPNAPARDQEDIEREERMNWELPNGGARVVSREGHDIDDRFDERFDDPDMEAPYGPEPDRDHDEPFDDGRDLPDERPQERYFSSHRSDEPSEPEFDDDVMEEAPVRRRDEFARRLKSVFPSREGKGDTSRKRDTSQKTRSSDVRAARTPTVPERPGSYDDRFNDDRFDDDDPLFARSERRAPPFDEFDPDREEPLAPAFEPEPTPEFDEGTPARSSFDSARWASRHPALERAARGMIDGEKPRTVLSDAEEIVVISVMSRDEDGFNGPDLLQLVLACGLRLDDRGVFHRFETESSDSPLQFSMVNVVKPGTFDLEVMDEDTTPGVTFLMPMPSAESSREAFEAMFETAMVLVRNLGGELKDENHSVMTAQTVEFARQRVHEFERRWRLHHHQAH
ncbi:cell division protein ZipA [Kushneria avicenniae]|uniref:Cell division protein ZipA n=1 Tax=Kushneria avicenniae TaxID=402385 RepID=A0A1I1KR21_9GAMM|nr:cell division protein ZipA [Kushneria avicenniae]SFC63237.1 cell division protein ZipA [Kushneria avicenniae]